MSSPHIEVVPAAAEQAPILANLLELYAHDLSEFHPLDLAADGRFGYSSLSLYWTQSDRHPFLVRTDGKLAGLVLVKKSCGVSGRESVWDMAEFFVIRGYRRRGIGTQVAHQVWRRLPGAWEVRVMQSNISAHTFWVRAISTFTDAPVHPVYVQESGEQWAVFSFESNGTGD